MDQHNEPGQMVAAKLASVWFAVGITSWSEAASFVAFLYTMWLILEKAWKTFLRRFFVRVGLVRDEA